MSILLYESYNPQRQRAFAKVKDTERTLTISLAAGKGVFIDAYATDKETGVKVTKAFPGQKLNIYVSVRNDGDKDTIWLTGKDKDTGTLIPYFDYSTVLDPGKHMGITHEVIMPNKNFNILLEAGHGK